MVTFLWANGVATCKVLNNIHSVGVSFKDLEDVEIQPEIQGDRREGEKNSEVEKYSESKGIDHQGQTDTAHEGTAEQKAETVTCVTALQPLSS